MDFKVIIVKTELFESLFLYGNIGPLEMVYISKCSKFAGQSGYKHGLLQNDIYLVIEYMATLQLYFGEKYMV